MHTVLYVERGGHEGWPGKGKAEIDLGPVTIRATTRTTARARSYLRQRRRTIAVEPGRVRSPAHEERTHDPSSTATGAHEHEGPLRPPAAPLPRRSRHALRVAHGRRLEGGAGRALTPRASSVKPARRMAWKLELKLRIMRTQPYEQPRHSWTVGEPQTSPPRDDDVAAAARVVDERVAGLHEARDRLPLAGDRRSRSGWCRTGGVRGEALRTELPCLATRPEQSAPYELRWRARWQPPGMSPSSRRSDPTAASAAAPVVREAHRGLGASDDGVRWRRGRRRDRFSFQPVRVRQRGRAILRASGTADVNC